MSNLFGHFERESRENSNSDDEKLEDEQFLENKSKQ